MVWILLVWIIIYTPWDGGRSAARPWAEPVLNATGDCRGVGVASLPLGPSVPSHPPITMS